MNGKTERMFGTLKGKLDRIKIDGQKTLQGLLANFRFWYNGIAILAKPSRHAAHAFNFPMPRSIST
ncbi:MAG TPA: hypothetical protein VFR06_03875 [Gallionellaceae bacterium]|nr:hypothetical protein [Gallionellaceae bacterium]